MQKTMEQQAFEKRVQDFIDDLVKLQEKHSIAIQAALKAEPFGIFPHIKYLDKREFDRMTMEASGVKVNNVAS